MNTPLTQEQDTKIHSATLGQVSGSEQKASKQGQHETDLLRSFTILSLLTIFIISIIGAFILTEVVTARMLKEDALVTQDFIQSAAGTERLPDRPYKEDFLNNKRWLAGYLQRIGRLPNTPLVKIYDPDQTILWATDKTLIGENFKDNNELQEALQGKLVYHQEEVSELGEATDKTDLTYFSHALDQVIEIYVPLWNAEHNKVLAVVELYKTPDYLFQAIWEIKLFIWSGVALGSTILFFVLFSIVRKASKTMQRQRQAIVESEALDTIGDMTSAMAHGIRNPLASIRSSAELALLSPDSAPRMSESIITSVDKLQDWINEFIQFTETESRFDNQIVVLDRLLEESLQLITEQANRQEIVIQLLPFETYAPVNGDPALLRQLMGIILDNCLDALPDGGIITVQQRSYDKHHLLIEITDNGTGIPLEKINSVFRPFSSNKKHGLGLGLMMAQRIAMHHSGHITLKSKEGEGTTVSVILPIVTNRRFKVLVIDDETTFAANLKSYLKQFEFDIELASSGAQGLEIAAEWQPDIVLTETRLSDMKGTQLCQEIRRISSSITIYALTGQANTSQDKFSDLNRQLQLSGAKKLLTKPLPLATIRTELEQAKSGDHSFSQT